MGAHVLGRFGQLESITKVGFDVVSLRLDEANSGFFCNTFLTGMRRAIDVLCAYNGRLYILEFNQDTDYDPGFGNWNTFSRVHEIRYTVAPNQPTILLSTGSFKTTILNSNAVDNQTRMFALSGQAFACRDWSNTAGPGRFVLSAPLLDVPMIGDAITTFAFDGTP